MLAVEMRSEARACAERARELIERHDEASARHACLEARFAIEYLTYDVLLAYLKEVPDDTPKKWTPRDVIGALREVDENADKSRIIAIAIEHTPGVPRTQGFESLGQDRRFSLKWAHRNHNALGSFLHAQTLAQVESGEVPSVEKIAAKVGSVLTEIESILDSPICKTNFGHFFEVDCKECGTSMRGRLESIDKQKGLVCPSAKCRATYIVEEAEQGSVRFLLRVSFFHCPHCSEKDHVGNQKVADGTKIECRRCGGKILFQNRFYVVPEGAADAGPPAAPNE